LIFFKDSAAIPYFSIITTIHKQNSSAMVSS
jgi:hypothetical protein